jgi:hypothetical protein
LLPRGGIATDILPDLIKLIAGDQSGAVAARVANALKTAAGTPQRPAWQDGPAAL